MYVLVYILVSSYVKDGGVTWGAARTDGEISFQSWVGCGVIETQYGGSVRRLTRELTRLLS